MNHEELKFMWILLLSSFVLFFMNPVQLFDWLALKTAPLALFCIQVNPFSDQSRPVWQALVCGQSLWQDPFWGNALRASGLIHIFVVSGSHFIVFSQILSLLRLPLGFQILVLWVFNAATGFTAPGTRACMAITLSQWLQLQSHQRTLCVGFLCLGLQPDWIFSFSFWLSWLAGFMLQFCPQDPFRVFQNSVFYATWSFLGSPLSLWSLVLNITIAPLIGWILFPLALLSFFPVFAQIFQWLLQSLEWILRILEMNQKKVPFTLSLKGLSFVVLATHFYFQAYNNLKRGRHVD